VSGVDNIEIFSPPDLSIPSVPEGDYQLVFYVDDTDEVSEYDENNNWTAVPITIEEPNEPPTAVDTSYDTAEDTPLVQAFPADDVDEDPLTFTVLSGPFNGTLTIAGDTFTYTPNPNFNGADSFTFKANDGELDSDIATVSITITADNDPPTAGSLVFDIFENTPLVGILPAEDIDEGDMLSFTLGTGPGTGEATIDSTTGEFTYTPAFNFLGTDVFTFIVSDAAGDSAEGAITINVLDPIPNWAFIGFDKPWRPNYKVNLGSAIPLKWFYANPDTGAIEPSYSDVLGITASRYEICAPVGQPVIQYSLPEDTGQSDIRYVDGNWQLNWDTVGLEAGCYFLEIYHPTTNQLDAVNHNGDLLMVELR
jgi:hypothetical protein